MKQFFVLFATLLLTVVSQAQTSEPSVELEVFANNLNRPVGIYATGIEGDDRVFILQQHSGVIAIYQTDGTFVGEFMDLNGLATSNEQGLLGMAFSPNYATDGFFYLNYTPNGGDTRISRFQVSTDPNVWDNNSEEILLEIEQDFGNHNGGHIQFGPDGYLYIGMGDGGSAGDPNNRAQDINSLLGKMLRIDVSGTSGYSVPPDNPYVGTAGADEIWAIGMRNPWKFDFDPQTNQLWIADVGQNAKEEVNLVDPAAALGANFGWKCKEGFSDFSSSGCSGLTFTDPVKDYPHFGFYNFCSITGGVVYRGSENPLLEGHYLFADYCDGRIFSLKPDGQGGVEETLLRDVNTFSFSAFGRDNNGEVYVSHINDGTVYKITEACGDFDPVISASGSGLSVSEGVAFQWYVNNEPVSIATESTFEPALGTNGSIYVLAENENGCVLAASPVQWGTVSGIVGCTQSEATNFNPMAVLDDGGCLFPLPGPECPADLDGNGVINTGDLVELLGAYGSACE